MAFVYAKYNKAYLATPSSTGGSRNGCRSGFC